MRTINMHDYQRTYIAVTRPLMNKETKLVLEPGAMRLFPPFIVNTRPFVSIESLKQELDPLYSFVQARSFIGIQVPFTTRRDAMAMFDWLWSNLIVLFRFKVI